MKQDSKSAFTVCYHLQETNIIKLFQLIFSRFTKQTFEISPGAEEKNLKTH